MAIIIDGYNLLHVTGISGVEGSTTLLHQSRHKLLRLLVAKLTPAESATTTIVFDAKQAPPGLPTQEEHGGITALFAKDYDEADDLIEELIRKESVPRRLLVVSSDHRLQRAARRRKAMYIDSDLWLNELEARPNAAGQAEIPPTIAEAMQSDPPEHWQAEFGDINVNELIAEIETEVITGDSTIIPTEPSPAKPAKEESAPIEAETDTPETTENLDDAKPVDNPFPRGYAEDVLEHDTEIDDYNPFPPGYGEDVT